MIGVTSEWRLHCLLSWLASLLRDGTCSAMLLLQGRRIWLTREWLLLTTLAILATAALSVGAVAIIAMVVGVARAITLTPLAFLCFFLVVVALLPRLVAVVIWPTSTHVQLTSGSVVTLTTRGVRQWLLSGTCARLLKGRLRRLAQVALATTTKCLELAR